MPDLKQLNIPAFNGVPLPNQFWPAEHPNNWLAILLPGLNYTHDMPLMYFTRRLLMQRGIDVLNLNPNTRSGSFQNATQEAQLAWLKADMISGLGVGLSQGNYQGVILAGKSIGTLSIAGALEQAEALLPTILLWITPLFKWEVVNQAAMQAEGPQLFLCGSADPTFVPKTLEKILAEKPLASAFIAPGANHNLECEGDVKEAFNGIFQGMAFMADFLDQAIPNPGHGRQ